MIKKNGLLTARLPCFANMRIACY